jgi:hypothetical protein
MSAKIALAIAMTGVMVAVALAPLVTSADAARSTTCSQGPSTGPCPGNSDANNPNRCETTRTGQGGGSGTIKDTTCPP